MKNVIITILIILALSITEAKALPVVKINLQVWHELGGNALSVERTKELLDLLRIKFEQAGIRVRLRQLKSGNAANDDWAYGLTSVNDIYETYRRSFARAKQGGMFGKKAFKNKKKRTYKLILNPGYIYNGELYMAGLALAVCPSTNDGSMAGGNAEEQNSDGANRFDHSVILACHELGHLLGAPHNDEGETIMHHASLQFVSKAGLGMGWHPDSIDMMRRCLRR